MAGILDGEGSISLDRPSRRPTVQVSSVDRELLEWIVARFGGGITSKKVYQAHHQPCWTWKVASRQAVDLLGVLLPYMVIERKRRRAQLIVDEYVTVTPRNGYYTAEGRAAKDDFTARFMAL